MSDASSGRVTIDCPKCGHGLCVSAKAVVGKDQRFTVTLHPTKDQQMIQAEALCGQIVDLDKLMQHIAKEDGGRVRTYVERLSMTKDGGFRFHLAVLDVVSKDAIATETRRAETGNTDSVEDEGAGQSEAEASPRITRP